MGVREKGILWRLHELYPDKWLQMAVTGKGKKCPREQYYRLPAVIVLTCQDKVLMSLLSVGSWTTQDIA